MRTPVALVLVAVALAAPAGAEPTACRRAVAKASAMHAQARMKALARCGDRVTTGALPAGTDCTVEPKTAATLAKAAIKLELGIVKACGGPDRVCGSGDDEALAAIGWSGGACPDLRDGGCTNAIADCGDVTQCLACLAREASAAESALHFGALDLASPPGSALETCQRVIGKAATKLFQARSKQLQKCWDRAIAGIQPGPCPTATADAIVARAETKLVRTICRACGGADRGCDAAVGDVPGTGGGDDATPAAIGFAASCPDVTPPGGTSCGASIATLADVVGCVACAGDFAARCLDRAAVPADAAYPAECTGEPAGPCGGPVHADTFPGADGTPWPGWTALGSVAVADVQGGRARLRPTPSGYSLARMGGPAAPRDVEATLTVAFEDLDTQGIGFYVRQNGGYLDATAPTGAGYAVFVEGFRGFDGIGVWREVDGIEQAIAIDMGLALADGVPYRVRFRVHQQSPTTTRLQAKLWPAADPEPLLWNVDATDTTPSLQNVAGAVAADSWSEITSPGPITAHTFIDDVAITELCNPIAGIGAVTTVSEAFQFTEGPLWRADGTLLFTDIDADTIHRLAPPSTVTVLRTPSNEANGLATDVNGDLLAAEHAGRRISRTDAGGVVTTVVGDYLGMTFNSPNDIAVRSDGTLYFTDPPFGLADPADREIPFNGLFRRTPAGVLAAEWMGAVGDGPNGVVLSPDETRLYVANTATGTVLLWDVAPDGGLSNLRPFADGLAIPDGMCVDAAGNVYVATWASTIEVFDPSGAAWGSVAVPRAATNCTIGGGALWVTAQEGLYRYPLP